jgi:hypothetical protein
MVGVPCMYCGEIIIVKEGEYFVVCDKCKNTNLTNDVNQ